MRNFSGKASRAIAVNGNVRPTVPGNTRTPETRPTADRGCPSAALAVSSNGAGWIVRPAWRANEASIVHRVAPVSTRASMCSLPTCSGTRRSGVEAIENRLAPEVHVESWRSSVTNASIGTMPARSKRVAVEPGTADLTVLGLISEKHIWKGKSPSCSL